MSIPLSKCIMASQGPQARGRPCEHARRSQTRGRQVLKRQFLSPLKKPNRNHLKLPTPISPHPLPNLPLEGALKLSPWRYSETTYGVTKIFSQPAAACVLATSFGSLVLILAYLRVPITSRLRSFVKDVSAPPKDVSAPGQIAEPDHGCNDKFLYRNRKAGCNR